MTKKVIIYGIGTIFAKILVFVMIPIYTRCFSVADFGYYDVMISNIQMIVSISFIEIWSGIMRHMFCDEDKYKAIKAFIVMFPVMCVFFVCIVFFMSNVVEVRYPLVICIYGIMHLLFNVVTTICRGLNRNIDYVVSGLIYTVVSCSMGVLVALVWHLGIKYLFISQVLGYVLVLLFVELRTDAFRKALKSKVDYKYIIEMLKYSIPLMLNSFSYLFLGTYNKNVVLQLLGEELSGQYAYVLKFSAIVSIIISIYSLAWQEQAFIFAEIKDRKEIYSFYINNFIKLIGFAIPCYIVFTIFISPYFGGASYESSDIYIPLVVAAAFFAEFSGIFSIVIAVSKKTHQTLISTTIGAIVNVLAVVTLVKNFGINGASISLCVSFITVALIRCWFSRNLLSCKKIQLWMVFIVLIEILTIVVFSYNKLILLLLGFIYFFIWIIMNLKNIIDLFITIKNKIISSSSEKV